MRRPSVSVVIPAYNQARYLAAAIESALGQTEVPHEVIVVDDGSTDDTPTVIADFGDRIRTIRQDNAGVTVTRNRGASAATGDLLSFLDSDDVWRPTKLERQVDRFVADPSLGLVHCGLQHIDADGELGNVRLDGTEGWVLDELLRFDGTVVLAGSSTMMVPRPLFESLGAFDESMSFSADWDLTARIARTHPIGFVREPLLLYRLHGANMTGNVAALEHDMLLAMTKALDANGAAPAVRARALAQVHVVLSGATLAAGRRGDALRHLRDAFRLRPTSVGYALALPLRRLRRRTT